MSKKRAKNLVVHPLFDKPEEKRDPDKVGPMTMTRTVRYSLIAVRAYLIAMMILAFYRTLMLAGILGH